MKAKKCLLDIAELISVGIIGYFAYDEYRTLKEKVTHLEYEVEYLNDSVHCLHRNSMTMERKLLLLTNNLTEKE